MKDDRIASRRSRSSESRTPTTKRPRSPDSDASSPFMENTELRKSDSLSEVDSSPGPIQAGAENFGIASPSHFSNLQEGQDRNQSSPNTVSQALGSAGSSGTPKSTPSQREVEFDPDPDIARLQRSFNSENSFNTGDDGAIPSGLPHVIAPGPFDDATPSFDGGQNDTIASRAPWQLEEEGLFQDTSPVSPGTKELGHQIYDARTNDTFDGTQVDPRTPPQQRLERVAAQREIGEEEGKEDEGEKTQEAAVPEAPSMFSRPGVQFTSVSGRIKDEYRNAPTMGDKDWKGFLKVSAEEQARVDAAEELQTEPSRQGSLLAMLENSVRLPLSLTILWMSAKEFDVGTTRTFKLGRVCRK